MNYLQKLDFNITPGNIRTFGEQEERLVQDIQALPLPFTILPMKMH